MDLGFDVISHTFNYNLLPVIIPNLFKACKDKFCSDFTKHSIEHFEKHLEEFTSKGVFCIPHLDENTSGTEPFLNRQINSIMSSMKSWCCKNGNDGNLKGFVIDLCERLSSFNSNGTHMHGLAVYVKEGLPFARDLSL